MTELSRHISIEGLIEYKLWVEDQNVKFQIVWQNPDTINKGTNGWELSVSDKFAVASYDFPELATYSVCLRGLNSSKNDFISRVRFDTADTRAAYIEKVISGIKTWSESDRARPVIQKWLEVNSEPLQLGLFE